MAADTPVSRRASGLILMRSHTLKLKWPFGRTLLLSLAFMPLFTGAFEGFTRTLIPDQVFPPPSVGSESPEFDIKVDRLDRFVAAEGKVDCILLGSSQVNGGIDPVALAEAYEAQSGEKLTCFNFGLSSLVGEVAGPMAQLLVRKYHPSLLILGVSARDFSDKFGEYARPLVNVPWVRYINGEFNRLGWLVEHSISFRYYLGLHNWRSAENRPVIARYMQEIDELGFQPLPVSNTEVGQLDEVLLTDYNLNPVDVEGFAQALRQNSTETRLLLVEMPVHPEFLPSYVDGSAQAYQDKFLGPIAGMALDAGVPLWLTQQEIAPQVPANGWKDRRHLNAVGAVAFSQWLGYSLAEAVQSGDFSNPSAANMQLFLPVIQQPAE